MSRTYPRARPAWDDKHKQMAVLFKEELTSLLGNRGYRNSKRHLELSASIDKLFASCPESCEQCGDIFCPYGESLHTHHDGCPCCSFEPSSEDRHQRAIMRNARWETLLNRLNAHAS